MSRRNVMQGWRAAGVLITLVSAFVLWRFSYADLGADSQLPRDTRQSLVTATPTTVTPATVTPATVTPATVTPATVTPATGAADPKQDLLEPTYHSPIHVCLAPDETRAYVVNRSANSVSVLDINKKTVIREIPVGRHPTHAILSRDGHTLFVTCQHDYVVAVVDLETGQVVRRLPTGYEPTGLALSSDGQRLSVANALADTVSVFDVSTGLRLREIPVGRLPRYLTETPDGKRLIVGNAHSRDLSIIDTATGQMIETRSLGRAAQLRQVICTQDGRWAFVALLVGHDEMITTQMERGWINSNGFAIVDLHEPGHYRLLLLDRLLQGATNPWALAMSTDEQRLYVSLAGIHEVAIVDIPRALELVARTKPEEAQRLSQDVEILERLEIARRVEVGGVGPRGLAFRKATGELFVANCFTDDISVLDAETGEVKSKIPLGPKQELTLWREGEMFFNDGRICYQNWNSCASCHQEDATIDSLNWDLINDGQGNPKNVKSMHNGILTPPAMWSGVRPDQHTAVMAGQRFLGFLPDDDIQQALIEYVGNPRRAPNPYRRKDVEAIQRGERVFYRARCDKCHVPPHLSDMKTHDIGLTGYTIDVDFRSRFDTPSLRECYRTAPYLHDGRAATLREIFTDHNPENAHGLTGGLSAKELDDLVAYLRSL